MNIENHIEDGVMKLPRNTLINLSRDTLIELLNLSVDDGGVSEIRCYNYTSLQGNHSAQHTGLEFIQVMRQQGFANYAGDDHIWLYHGRDMDYTNGQSSILDWDMVKAYQYYHGSRPELTSFLRTDFFTGRLTHLFEPLSSTGDFSFFAQQADPDLHVTLLDLDEDALTASLEYPWVIPPTLIADDVTSFNMEEFQNRDSTLAFVGKNSHCAMPPKMVKAMYEKLSKCAKYVAMEIVIHEDLTQTDGYHDTAIDTHLTGLGISCSYVEGECNFLTRSRSLDVTLTQTSPSISGVMLGERITQPVIAYDNFRCYNFPEMIFLLECLGAVRIMYQDSDGDIVDVRALDNNSGTLPNKSSPFILIAEF